MSYTVCYHCWAKNNNTFGLCKLKWRTCLSVYREGKWDWIINGQSRRKQTDGETKYSATNLYKQDTDRAEWASRNCARYSRFNHSEHHILNKLGGSLLCIHSVWEEPGTNWDIAFKSNATNTYTSILRQLFVIMLPGVYISLNSNLLGSRHNSTIGLESCGGFVHARAASQYNCSWADCWSRGRRHLTGGQSWCRVNGWTLQLALRHTDVLYQMWIYW